MKRSGYNIPDYINRPQEPLLIVLSGLSGAGKDAVLSRLKAELPGLHHIITTTTRAPRKTETDGVDYNFISEAKFLEMVEQGDFLEHANVYGNWYGVPRPPVRQALQDGNDTIVKVDIQGVANIKNIIPEAVFVFLVPDSLEELNSRLTNRNTESASELSLRTKAAEEELERLSLCDYVVKNKRGKLDEAVQKIKAIIAAEKCRQTPRAINI